MGTAYTPGLTVSADQIVRKTRRLPLKGEVLVKVGDIVNPDTVVAKTELPGILQSVKLANKLGVEPKDVPGCLRVKIGDRVHVGDLLAETKGLFGLFKGTVFSEYEGTVESLSETTGHLLIREPAIPIEIAAYMKGTIVEVIPEDGAVVETRGALIQGIFGVGSEQQGDLKVVVSNPNETLDVHHISDDDTGKILIGGNGITFEAIKKAESVGVVGLVVGAIRDVDLIKYLGYDIGVAITGQENIPLTIIATEGFGTLAMATRTFDLFNSLEGRAASINGATQIRAGVIRPEVIVPAIEKLSGNVVTSSSNVLDIGTPIRIIREPYFGRLGTVSELPPELVVVESGTEVRVLKAKLDSGEDVVVPRANVEIIAT